MFGCEYCGMRFNDIDKCVKHENECSRKEHNLELENDPWGMCIYDDEYRHSDCEHWLDDEYSHH